MAGYYRLLFVVSKNYPSAVTITLVCSEYSTVLNYSQYTRGTCSIPRGDGYTTLVDSGELHSIDLN